LWYRKPTLKSLAIASVKIGICLLAGALLVIAFYKITASKKPSTQMFPLVPSFEIKSDDSYSRAYAIKTSLKIWQDHFIFGLGPGMFGGWISRLTDSPVYQEYQWDWKGLERLSSIDSYWPQVWCETGLIGLGLYLWLIFAILACLRKIYRQTSGISPPEKHKDTLLSEQPKNDVSFALIPLLALGLGMQLFSISINAWVGPTFNVAPVSWTLFALIGMTYSVWESEKATTMQSQ
ncbi:unnamed protein product, partial [marine sediment metagenome]